MNPHTCVLAKPIPHLIKDCELCSGYPECFKTRQLALDGIKRAWTLRDGTYRIETFVDIAILKLIDTIPQEDIISTISLLMDSPKTMEILLMFNGKQILTVEEISKAMKYRSDFVDRRLRVLKQLNLVYRMNDHTWKLNS